MEPTNAAAESDVAEGSPRNPAAVMILGEPRTPAPPTGTATGTATAARNRPLAVSSEALASIVRSLVASKEAKLQVQYDEDDEVPGTSSGGLHKPAEGEDEALYQEAIAMLREELARLTDQMMTETDVAARIRQQVGGMAFDTRIDL